LNVPWGSYEATFDGDKTLTFDRFPKAYITNLFLFLCPSYQSISLRVVRNSLTDVTELRDSETLVNLEQVTCCVWEEKTHRDGSYRQYFAFTYDGYKLCSAERKLLYVLPIDLSLFTHEEIIALNKPSKETIFPFLVSAFLSHLPQPVRCHWVDGMDYGSANHVISALGLRHGRTDHHRPKLDNEKKQQLWL
jgi:hypothetical protein